jgi:hypothetical protein
MLPPALHRFQGALVRLIAPGDYFLQMLIFRLYDLVGRISMEREVTRPAHLLACHGLHEVHFLPRIASPARATAGREVPGGDGEGYLTALREQ